jgi:hypothetical protein
MATISVIKEAIQLCKEAEVTPFIWGHRGCGKSSLVRQVCNGNQWGFIDLRCSQLEASDIRGLPDRGEDRRTHYLPPADMPIGDMAVEEVHAELAEVLGISVGTAKKREDAIVKSLLRAAEEGDLETQRRYSLRLQELQPRMQHGILLLDELNRAQDDVLQAAFQLVLDRRVGQYVLPPGWGVVAAGNFMEGYIVSGFNDPAFLDRFCHMTLSIGETTLEEWVHYMGKSHGSDAFEVIEFASQNTKHLDGDISGELGFSIQPSRRSWELLVQVGKAMKAGDYSSQALFEVQAGLVGRELAQVFSRYSCPVKPKDLLDHGVKKYEKKLKDLSRNQRTGLMWGLVSFAKDKIDDDNVSEVCLDFASWLVRHSTDKDIAVAFCRALVGGGDPKDQQVKAKAAVISNPRLADMIAKFNKQAGDRKKCFVDRLTERPDLQKAMSNVAWGVHN